MAVNALGLPLQLQASSLQLQDLLGGLQPGNTLKARVVELLPDNKAVINLKGQNLVAELPAGSQAQKGSVLSLEVTQVAQADAGKAAGLTLRLLPSAPAAEGPSAQAPVRNLPPQAVLDQAISAARLPNNAVTQQVARTLAQLGVPLTPQALASAVNAVESLLANEAPAPAAPGPLPATVTQALREAVQQVQVAAQLSPSGQASLVLQQAARDLAALLQAPPPSASAAQTPPPSPPQPGSVAQAALPAAAPGSQANTPAAPQTAPAGPPPAAANPAPATVSTAVSTAIATAVATVEQSLNQLIQSPTPAALGVLEQALAELSQVLSAPAPSSPSPETLPAAPAPTASAAPSPAAAGTSQALPVGAQTVPAQAPAPQGPAPTSPPPSFTAQAPTPQAPAPSSIPATAPTSIPGQAPTATTPAAITAPAAPPVPQTAGQSAAPAPAPTPAQVLVARETVVQVLAQLEPPQAPQTPPPTAAQIRQSLEALSQALQEPQSPPAQALVKAVQVQHPAADPPVILAQARETVARIQSQLPPAPAPGVPEAPVDLGALLQSSGVPAPRQPLSQLPPETVAEAVAWLQARDLPPQRPLVEAVAVFLQQEHDALPSAQRAVEAARNLPPSVLDRNPPLKAAVENAVKAFDAATLKPDTPGLAQRLQAWAQDQGLNLEARLAAPPSDAAAADAGASRPALKPALQHLEQALQQARQDAAAQRSEIAGSLQSALREVQTANHSLNAIPLQAQAAPAFDTVHMPLPVFFSRDMGGQLSVTWRQGRDRELQEKEPVSVAVALNTGSLGTVKVLLQVWKDAASARVLAQDADTAGFLAEGADELRDGFAERTPFKLQTLDFGVDPGRGRAAGLPEAPSGGGFTLSA